MEQIAKLVKQRRSEGEENVHKVTITVEPVYSGHLETNQQCLMADRQAIRQKVVLEIFKITDF